MAQHVFTAKKSTQFWDGYNLTQKIRSALEEGCTEIIFHTGDIIPVDPMNTSDEAIASAVLRFNMTRYRVASTLQEFGAAGEAFSSGDHKAWKDYLHGYLMNDKYEMACICLTVQLACLAQNLMRNGMPLANAIELASKQSGDWHEGYVSYAGCAPTLYDHWEHGEELKEINRHSDNFWLKGYFEEEAKMAATA